MSDEDFMKIVREYINRVAETEVDKLIERILSRERKSKEELLQLEKDVRDFFRSDASDEDKRKLSGYTEGLSMICCAIREGRL